MFFKMSMAFFREVLKKRGVRPLSFFNCAATSREDRNTTQRSADGFQQQTMDQWVIALNQVSKHLGVSSYSLIDEDAISFKHCSRCGFEFPSSCIIDGSTDRTY